MGSFVDGGDIFDSFEDAAASGSITVGTSAVEAKVGVDRLTARESVTITNLGSSTIYWGTSNSVTTSNGTPIFRRQQTSIPVTDKLEVWLIAPFGSQDVRIVEQG